MTAKLFVNDFGDKFFGPCVAAEAGGRVSPVTARAATVARLPTLLSFFICILPTPTFFFSGHPAGRSRSGCIQPAVATLSGR